MYIRVLSEFLNGVLITLRPYTTLAPRYPHQVKRRESFEEEFEAGFNGFVDAVNQDVTKPTLHPEL